MSFLRAFGKFWYDFVIGDDWKIAVGVVTAVGLTIGLLTLNVVGDVGVAIFGAIAIISAFAISLAIDVRSSPGLPNRSKFSGTISTDDRHDGK